MLKQFVKDHIPWEGLQVGIEPCEEEGVAQVICLSLAHPMSFFFFVFSPYPVEEGEGERTGVCLGACEVLPTTYTNLIVTIWVQGL